MIRSRVYGDSIGGLAEELGDELQPRLVRGARAGAEVVAKYIRRNLSRTGKDDAVLGPGAPPLKRSGELLASIEVLEPKVRKGSAICEYGSKHPGAGVLEWGGWLPMVSRLRGALGRWAGRALGPLQKVYHPPHSYVRPAEAAAKEEAEAAMEAELEKPS